MNKRIVLLDSEEVNVLNYIGCGLPSYYTIQDLSQIPSQSRDHILDLGPGDAALLIGGGAFKYLREKYHFGIRGENYFDCSQLDRLSIEGGGFVKVLPVDRLPLKEEVDMFMSSDFTRERDFSYFRSAITHTYEESKPFLNYLLNLPQGTPLGFDYEASGMPMDVFYEITGASLATSTNAVFFSFSDIKRDCLGRGPEGERDWKEFLQVFGQVLIKHQKSMWTFNLQYEQQATWRYFGLDLEFCDSGVFNIIEAFHMKNYSLKWTAQRVLKATVWDTDFDRLGELFEEMYFTTEQDPSVKGKKGQKKVLKVTPENYDKTSEWAEINRLYPGYEREFRQLISEYFGQPFMNIPSDILGKYCNLDAFYTLEIYLETKDKYSQDCIDVFLDNLRMGAVLHSCGMYKDEAFRQEYDKYCIKMMTYGITYCSTARCKMRMDGHRKKANRLEDYDPFARLLIERVEFFGGNAMDITKNLLVTNLDPSIKYDPNLGNESGLTGLDLGGMMMKYGMEYYDYIVAIDEALREVLIETKNNKPKQQYKETLVVNKKTGETKPKRVKDGTWTVQYGPIDDSICRKKKILDLMVPKIAKIIGLDKIDLGQGHQELEKYIFYKKSYEEFLKVWDQLRPGGINAVPDSLVFEGKTWTDLLEYSDYVSDKWFKCKSPEENDTIITELTKAFRNETVFLSCIGESFQQMSGEYKFYENLGIKDINTAFGHFLGELSDWATDLKNAKKGLPSVRPQGYSYPQKVFDLAGQFLKNSKDIFKYQKDLALNEIAVKMATTAEEKKALKDAKPKEVKILDPIKTTWADFDGFYKQANFFPELKKEYKEMGSPWSEDDMKDNFFFMRKMCLMYLEYKKHAKILSTYMRGMFRSFDKWVIEGPGFYPIRDARIDENGNPEPGAVLKTYSHYEICKKTSKRSSSGWHTIK